MPGGGRARGREGQSFGPAYSPYGGGRSRGRRRRQGRRHRRRRRHGAEWQGGRGDFPPAHLGQNHGQGYGQEGYGQDYYDEEDYGQEGYDGSQYGGQGDWQHALSEMEVSRLREQLRQCQEALREAHRSNEEEIRALHHSHMAQLERAVQSAERIAAENNGLRKGLEERDQCIALRRDEIRSVIAERNSIKGELESRKQVERNLRSASDRIIEDLKRKEGEAKDDVV
ncbi:hypothetical protein CDV31_014778 [Fusarium ambrosium]|uniref:Uncharacterized protein n=1 Tax=Fusarium ambrosium TaxID=131363 RepID=A0A428SU00_9HYPO|nr:hypothetical protein CDV31_014778 [Fusarium ambrosium]